MSEFATFGDPARFEIAIRWRRDDEPRSRRPAAHGWSMGDLKITVANRILTQNKRGKDVRPHISWYLSPFFDWLASCWLRLTHEESFSWVEHSSMPAVAACSQAIGEFIAAEDKKGREIYRAVQDWYFHHGIQYASEGGLFPDIFFRRLSNDIEISWLPDTPQFAGEDFSFLMESGGVSRFPVEYVAGPLWLALRWFTENPPPHDDFDEIDRQSWARIRGKIHGLRDASPADMEAAFLRPTISGLLGNLRKSPKASGLFSSLKLPDIPALGEFSPAVAMFGGVSPDLGRGDVNKLLTVMEGQCGGADTDRLAGIVKDRGRPPSYAPYKEGYSLAEDLLMDIEQPADGMVDIMGIVDGFGIDVDDIDLETNTIRGIAIAGEGFSPKILINRTSTYNMNEAGRRFTVAHELCHILHDRSRAKRVTHVSGSWVSPGVEKRANAFAAYFLMPRKAVVSLIGDRDAGDPEVVQDVATHLQVSETALVEHLYNLRLIEDWEREELRWSVKGHSK